MIRRLLPVLIIVSISVPVASMLTTAPAAAMTPGTHALVGAGLAYEFADSPFDGLVLGIVSHAVLDAIPHNDQTRWIPAITLAVSAMAINEMYKKSGNDPKVLWGAAGGVLPDLEHALYAAGIIKRNQKVFPTHTGLIKQPRTSPEIAAFVELGLGGVLVGVTF